MKLPLLTLYILTSALQSLAVQQLAPLQLSGVIVDVSSRDTLYNVAITNLTAAHHIVRKLRDGIFNIAVQPNDRIRFSLQGYETQELVIYSDETAQFQSVQLRRKPVTLDTLVVSGRTAYQEDSLARRVMFGKKVDEKPAQFRIRKRDKAYGSEGPGAGTFRLEAPLSSLLQKRSKKYKKLLAFQNRFKQTESDLFIESRYNADLVTELTGLEGETCSRFMKEHPMPLDFARAASDLEIAMWIKYNFRQQTQ